MRTFLLACALVAATASTAAAKDSFDTFVADLVAKPDAAKAYLSGCQTLVAPSGQLRAPCTLTLADLVGAQTGVTLVVKANKSQHFPKSQLQWREATVEAKAGKKVVASFRVVEVLAFGGPDDESAVGTMVASHWARLISDKDAVTAAKAAKLPQLPDFKHQVVPSGKPKSKDYDQDENDRAQATESVQDALGANISVTEIQGAIAGFADDGAIIFGSGPKQRYTGTKGGASIRKWRLVLAPSNAIHVDGSAWVLWGVTKMTAHPSTPGGYPMTYVVFAVFVSRLTPGR